MLETEYSATLSFTGRRRLLTTQREHAEFNVFSDIPADPAEIDEAAFRRPALAGFFLRWHLERQWLIRAGIAADLSRVASARAAALFIAGEQDWLEPADELTLPGWVRTMASEVPPGSMALARLWPGLAKPDIERIREAWSHLGTAEALMETGGDIRLERDPRTALNGYGCSHRPRPWAITFASSTASSSSERGYIAADAARLAATAAMLRHGVRPAVNAALEEIRNALQGIYGLPAGGAVVLAASGTDTELFALALTHLATPAQPILNILIAPEETGSGVPMAARGLHFAVDTALGHDVSREAPIDGFRPDTRLANIPLRDADGAARPANEVEAEIEAVVLTGIAAGNRVILHTLDLSKTGLLAPGLDCLKRLRAAYGDRFDIVVDACQARLSPASVQEYFALDATVLITGSKFFTGPPFAGAILIPPAIAQRLQRKKLPAGLDAYFGRDEFPADCLAASDLPAMGNYGLALRWHAALAEIHALFAVSPQERTKILHGFAEVVAEKISAIPALAPLPLPSLYRHENEDEWERCPSVFGFSLNALHAPGRCLNPDEARLVYHWLNTDLSKVLPDLSPAEAILAARICHIGQPVKLPGNDGSFIGVLRVSAGARLISGEPSHGGLAADARITREFDDLRCVFDKIALILEHFPALKAGNPTACYRSP